MKPKRLIWRLFPVVSFLGVTAICTTSYYTDDFDNPEFIAVVCALFVLTTYFACRSFVRPLEEISIQARRIRKGHFDERISSENYDSKETAQIIKSVNRMASKLDDQSLLLNQKSREMDAMMSSMGEGIIAIDSNFNVLFVNGSAKHMLGIDAKIERQNLLEFVRKTEFIEFARRTSQTKTPRSTEFEIGSEGDMRWLFLRSHLFQIPGSKLLGMVILLSDVTELKKLENYRKDFVANVSHELRTPLTAIKGFGETLANIAAKNDNQDIQRISEIINKQAQRLSDLVNDILLLSKMESQERQALEKQFSSCEVSTLISNAIQICQEKARRKSITVKTESVLQGVTVRAIPHLFEQAIGNLIDNALNYSPNGTQVIVSTEKPSHDTVCVSVKDEGPGIGGNHLPRLFERFYRIDHGRDRNAGGTGLGLSIVKHIAQLHGGRVEVKSEPGKGSDFRILVPTQDAHKVLTVHGR